MQEIIQRMHQDLQALGVEKGDALFVHSSLKSLGPIEGGAKTVIEGLKSYLGDEGTLLFPGFSWDSVTRENPVFDYYNTVTCVGYLPEFFRTQVKGVVRSIHGTHSCCALGKRAEELVNGHEKDVTPVGKNSPLYKLWGIGGKILFIGCSSNHNTTMHGVEELFGASYCINKENPVNYVLGDRNGKKTTLKSYRHLFHWNGEHVGQCYARLENLLNAKEMKKGKLLQADCTLMLSSAVWEKGLEKLKQDEWYFVDAKR